MANWQKISLLFIAAAILVVLIKFIAPFFKSSNSFLKVATTNIESTVYLNDRRQGTTPYLGKHLPAGEYSLRLKGRLEAPFAKKVVFSTPITLTSQTLTAVTYEFGPNEQFSSGDIRTFRSGTGFSVVTTPSGADVWLDGELVGKSPLSLDPNHGVHKLKITGQGYIGRELEINIEDNFRLIVEVFLSLNPYDEVKALTETGIKLYDLSTAREELLGNTALWAEGVFFFEKNIKLEFDALVDRQGKVYYQNKKIWDEKVKKGSVPVVGYLGDKNDKVITSPANKALANLKKPVAVAKVPTVAKVQVLSTPTGTLNVRAGPGLNYNIVATVKPGEEYELIEENGGWYKIKLPSTTGWISSQYAEKL
ncbi:MAG: SH3 domain-containing protein [bacterium]|nr:SH3 domain-containing protein [bacterium]